MTQLHPGQALIALGSNQPTAAGSPAEIILLALKEISAAGLAVLRCSRLYDTPAFPNPDDPAYVNAVVEITSDSAPEALLERLHAVETRFGRKRIERWGMRTLDLDLLACGDLVLPDVAGFKRWHGLAPEERGQRAPEELILPHPRLQERAFVLVPLAEIAPSWRHPVLGLTVTEMVAQLPDAVRAAVRPRRAD